MDHRKLIVFGPEYVLMLPIQAYAFPFTALNVFGFFFVYHLYIVI